jgi:rod shape-determining protein MreD
VRRAILAVVVVAVALTAQLTVVNRLPLPGAGAPDLVLLAVVALGLCSRPATAAVTGFGAGLCLDIAPPGSYLIGEYALVFCLVGYLCGRIRGVLNHSAMLTIAGAMGAAAAGEALVALLGLAVSDPQVSWPAVRQVLPSSIVYDVAVSPFLLYLVMRAVRWADGLGRAGVAGGQPADGSALLARSLGAGGALSGSALPGATVLGGAGLLGGAGWLAGPVGSRGSGGRRPRRGGGKPHVPRTPRLREAAARSGDGWVGGGPRPGLTASAGLRAGRPPLARRPGRPPRLRPGAGTPGSALARPPRALPRSPANLRIRTGRRGDGSLGRALGSGSAGPGASALRGRTGSGPPGSAFRGRRPAAGRPGAARSGAAGRAGSSGGPRFRPETRLPGGSSNEAALRGAALQRGMPSRRVSLRLGNARRHDGVLGGSALRGGALAGRAHRGLGARPVSLRLGSGRRGDGALGGLSGGRPPWARPRLSSQRRAAPRFRSGPAVGGHSPLGKRAVPRAGKRARFGSGRSSFLATWTGGRLGGRSTVWRIGSKRTGGFR